MGPRSLRRAGAFFRFGAHGHRAAAGARAFISQGRGMVPRRSRAHQRGPGDLAAASRRWQNATRHMVESPLCRAKLDTHIPRKCALCRGLRCANCRLAPILLTLAQEHMQPAGFWQDGIINEDALTRDQSYRLLSISPSLISTSAATTSGPSPKLSKAVAFRFYSPAGTPRPSFRHRFATDQFSRNREFVDHMPGAIVKVEPITEGGDL
jgi:hypothetical protein